MFKGLDWMFKGLDSFEALECMFKGLDWMFKGLDSFEALEWVFKGLDWGTVEGLKQV